MIFTKRYRYRFGDIDDAGIAYYPAMFHYFHCCFEDWWSDGLDRRILGTWVVTLGAELPFQVSE